MLLNQTVVFDFRDVDDPAFYKKASLPELSPVTRGVWLYRAFSVVLSTMHINAFDVKALRAFRVLRPLKLVSGVPSK